MIDPVLLVAFLACIGVWWWAIIVAHDWVIDDDDEDDLGG